MQRITEYLINKQTKEALNTDPYYYSFFEYNKKFDIIEEIHVLEKIVNNDDKYKPGYKYKASYNKGRHGWTLFIKDKPNLETDAIFFQENVSHNIMYFIFETKKLLEIFDNYIDNKKMSITYLSGNSVHESIFTKDYKNTENYYIKEYKKQCKKLLNI